MQHNILRAAIRRLLPLAAVFGAVLTLGSCAGYGVVSQSGGYCSAPANASCAAGSFCQLTDGQCNFANVGGTCTTPPTSCPNTSEPVCGCNGQTYRNRCEATRAQTSVAYTGGCVERQPPQS